MNQLNIYQVSASELQEVIQGAMRDGVRDFVIRPLNAREISAKTAAGILGMNVATIYENARNGIIPGYQRAGKDSAWVFHVGDIIQYLLDHPKKGRNQSKQ